MPTKDMTKKKLPVFTLKRCKQCGICSHFCPKDAIEMGSDGYPFLARPEDCTSCGLCEEMCPDWVISLEAPGLAAAEEGAAS